MNRFSTATDGFTILELAVSITIIGILASLVLTVPSSMRVSARDQERSDDVASLVRRLEQAYIGQEIGGPAYPSTAEFLSDISTKTRTARRLEDGALKAPGMSTSSVVGATSNSKTNPINGMTKDQYVYQPLTANGTICNAANSINAAATTCVTFNLYYLTETDGSLKRVKSLYQQ